MGSNVATLIGASAILMWSTLGILTALSGSVPPFQMVAMAFSVAFALTLATWLVRGQSPLRHLAWPPRVWALGVGGLFGYHFFYFMALRNAPVVEANLVNYLWPLLIVVFSGFLPGHRLRWWHGAGAMLGLGGAVLLVTDGGRAALGGGSTLGYLMAALAGVTWAGYSVLSRRFAHVPTDAVGAFCGATALAATACHLAFETTVWPADTTQWLAVLGMGLGPVGAAFFVWDVGMKKGHIQALGAMAYATPLLSTLLLVVFGGGRLDWVVAAACGLIVGGAVLASQDVLRRL